MLREICQYIEDETSFVIGTDFFYGWTPQDAPVSCITALERVGGVLYHDLPDRNDFVLQILSRSLDYITAYDNAITVFDLLHGMGQFDLPVVDVAEYHVMYSVGQQAPGYIGFDEHGRHQFSVNFILKTRDN